MGLVGQYLGMFTELVAQHGATGSQRRVVQPLLPLRSIHDQLAQTVQRQPGGEDLDGFRLPGDDLRQAAGGNHFHILALFLAEAFHHAFHQGDIAIEQA